MEPRWNSLPSTAARSITALLPVPELVEAAASSAWTVGGTERRQVSGRRPAALLANEKAVVDEHREHLLDEERVALRASACASPSPRRDRPCRRDLRPAWSARLLRERFEKQRGRIELAARPVRADIEQLGRAMHRSRIGPPRDQSARCSTRSRNMASPQWMSSNTTTTGRSRPSASKNLADRSETLVDSRFRLASPIVSITR